MRVSSYSFTRYAVKAINDKQQTIAKLQTEIGTGKKLLSPSDSPSEVATAENLSASIQRVQQYEMNTTLASQRLTQEETVLTHVSDALTRMKELAIQANTGILNAGDKAAISAEASAIRGQLLDYANSQTPSGDYLFAGGKGDTKPFNDEGSIAYRGDQTDRYIQISDSRRVKSTDSGDRIFSRILDGNGVFSTVADVGNSGTGMIEGGTVTAIAAYQPKAHSISFTDPAHYEVRDDAGNLVTSGAYSPGQGISFNGLEVSINGAPDTGDQFIVKPAANTNVFDFVDNFVSALNTAVHSDTDQASYYQAMGQAIGNLDRSIEHIQSRRSDLGSRLSYIDTTVAENKSIDYLLNKTRGEIEDTDFAKAASDLQYQMTTLDAVRKTYLQMQSMSLFNYM